MPFLSAIENGLNNHVNFVGCMRTPFTKQWASRTLDELVPLILYRGEAAQRYFGGLLFEAWCDKKGGLISPRYLGMASPASSAGWKQAAVELFTADRNIDATLKIAKQLPPNDCCDIWIALPYPPGNQREPFGNIDNRTISFTGRTEDRLAALKWWIDLILSGWERTVASLPGQQVQLCGFVWLKNYLDAGDSTVIAAIGDYCRERNTRLIWCQNYGTTKAHEGHELGFDLVFTRPTYQGKTEKRGEDWVKYASAFSQGYQLGMIMWEPAGIREQAQRWIQLGQTYMEGAFHFYEFEGGRGSTLLNPADPFYTSLFQYMREMDARNVMPTAGGGQS